METRPFAARRAAAKPPTRAAKQPSPPQSLRAVPSRGRPCAGQREHELRIGLHCERRGTFRESSAAPQIRVYHNPIPRAACRASRTRDGQAHSPTGTPRTRPEPARSYLAQHDVHGGHRPVRRNPLRRSGDGRPAVRLGLGAGSGPRAARWLRLGRTRCRDAAGRRLLRFSARSLRPTEIRPPDELPFYLANAHSGAAQHFFRRAWLCGLLEIPHRKSPRLRRVARIPRWVDAPLLRKLRAHRFDSGDRCRRRAALSQNFRDRQNLHRALGDRPRHDFLADLRRRHALQRRASLHLRARLPGIFPGFFSPASATPAFKPFTAISAITTSAISAAR